MQRERVWGFILTAFIFKRVIKMLSLSQWVCIYHLYYAAFFCVASKIISLTERISNFCLRKWLLEDCWVHQLTFGMNPTFDLYISYDTVRFTVGWEALSIYALMMLRCSKYSSILLHGWDLRSSTANSKTFYSLRSQLT